MCDCASDFCVVHGTVCRNYGAATAEEEKGGDDPTKKMEIVKRIEQGWSTSSIMSQNGLVKSAFFDIKAAKDTIRKYLQTFGKAMLKSAKWKVMLKPKHKEVDQSTLIWLRQQRAAGVKVRGMELKHATIKFAKLYGARDFKASEG